MDAVKSGLVYQRLLHRSWSDTLAKAGIKTLDPFLALTMLAAVQYVVGFRCFTAVASAPNKLDFDAYGWTPPDPSFAGAPEGESTPRGYRRLSFVVLLRVLRESGKRDPP